MFIELLVFMDVDGYVMFKNIGIIMYASNWVAVRFACPQLKGKTSQLIFIDLHHRHYCC